MEKVVKCKNEICNLHFGYSEENTKCPFCHTPYTESHIIFEKKSDTKNNEIKNEDKPKERKITVKVQKESFKIWKVEDEE